MDYKFINSKFLSKVKETAHKYYINRGTDYRKSDYFLAETYVRATLDTLLALGYNISVEKDGNKVEYKTSIKDK